MDKSKFDTQTHDFEFKGRKYSATVEISTAFDECSSIDDLIDSKAMPDVAAQLERELNNGNAMVAVILVKAFCSDLPDLEGHDSLGGTVIRSPKDVELTLKDYNMVENALSDLVASYERELESARDKVRRLEAV